MAALAPPVPAPGSIEYFALLYTPRAHRLALTTLLALRTEIASGIEHALDHDVAHARLEWWRTEAERFARGEPQHPWLRALWQQDESSRTLDLAPLIEAGARDLATRALAGQSNDELHRTLFLLAAQALGAPAREPATRAALEQLARAGEQLSIEPTWQPVLAPLLVWHALAARHQRRSNAAASRLDGFADNILAWRVARRASQGRYRARDLA